MIDQKLKQLVVDEALKLRKYLNKEEKDRFADNLTIGSSCVYDNTFEKPDKIMSKCAKPFSVTPLSYIKSKYKLYSQKGAVVDFSPIEFYINQPGAKIEDLVNLIKL